MFCKKKEDYYSFLVLAVLGDFVGRLPRKEQ
jgi:hypothetical protein